MENLNFNDAIKNVKSFSSPDDNKNLIQNNNKEKNNNSPKEDFSFKKNLNNIYDEVKNINNKEKDISENTQKSIYSKNEDNIFSSGNFGTKKYKKQINDENIIISNFSIFKESIKSKFSSFDNYLYSSSSIDNMDFNYTNNTLINNNISNIKEISQFSLPISINNENKNPNINYLNNNIKIEKINQINNDNNFINNNPLINNKKIESMHNNNDVYNINNNSIFNYKRNINEFSLKNEQYKINDINKSNKLKINKNHKKSSNKFIIFNNSDFRKELNKFCKKYENMSINKENKDNLIIIEEENQKKVEKNNLHSFPNNNNYISIRKAFEDITNKNYNNIYKKKKKENKKLFKAKMPKNFEIHKRKINIIKFEELIKEENNKEANIKKKKGGCICRQYKNKL